jgi:hypothetical protein
VNEQKQEFIGDEGKEADNVTGQFIGKYWESPQILYLTIQARVFVFRLLAIA